MIILFAMANPLLEGAQKKAEKLHGAGSKGEH